MALISLSRTMNRRFHESGDSFVGVRGGTLWGSLYNSVILSLSGNDLTGLTSRSIESGTIVALAQLEILYMLRGNQGGKRLNSIGIEGSAFHSNSPKRARYILVKTLAASIPPFSRINCLAFRKGQSFGSYPTSLRAKYASTVVLRSPLPPQCNAHVPSSRWFFMICAASFLSLSASFIPK